MNREEIEAICRERLEGWQQHLVEEHATPIILVGMGHDERSGELVVCTTEGLAKEYIVALLEGGLRMLRRSLETGEW